MPPLAITGIMTASLTARELTVKALGGAFHVHGYDQQFAGAECCAALRPFNYVNPLRSRPFSVYASQLLGAWRLASMESTMHCDPNTAAI